MFIMFTVINKRKWGEKMDNMVGERIRNRRKDLKMNQETLAEKSNVCRATISAIENGKLDNVLIGTLSAIATALDTTVDFFLK